MPNGSPNAVLISIVAPDRVGLIAEVAGELYALGANLGDTSFAVLGTGCEMNCVAELPGEVGAVDVDVALRRLPTLEGAELRVTTFPFSAEHGESAEVTHIIEVEGGDRPGLLARMSEVFMQFGANVVRMNSRRQTEASGNRYLTTFSVAMPRGRAEACLAAIHNTASQLNLHCRYRTA